MNNYKTVMYGKKSERRNYSKIRSEIDLPNLIEIQTKSFDWFIKEGLDELFKEISPIESQKGELKIYFGAHRFEEAKYGIVESKLRDINYSRPLKVNVRLEKTQTGEQIERELFMGDIPYMTPVGTFIINGAERVIISQIVRSAGVYYAKDIDKKTGKIKFTGQVMPTHGDWIKFDISSKGLITVVLAKSSKINIITVLRALGLESNDDIQKLFNVELLDESFKKDTTTTNDEAVIEVYQKMRGGDTESYPDGARKTIRDHFFNKRAYELFKVGRYKYNAKLDIFNRVTGLRLAQDVVCADDVFDNETGELIHSKGDVIAKRGQVIEGAVLEELKRSRKAFTYTIDLHDTLAANPQCEILDVYSPLGNKDKTVRVIGNNSDEDTLTITLSDMLASISYYLNLFDGVGSVDDIDHLGNRRLRLIGELLKNQFRAGFRKLEKNVANNMSTTSDLNSATPETLINIKPLTSSLKEFFGSSQLSQFMDQINPLAEITQKRRISALGSGGISRDRAGVEVRDVHNSHYGRMCPIETPEGPSIGLITSLATYAKVNDYGFIETPYFEVKTTAEGKKYVSNDIVYLSADKEMNKVIASASAKLVKDEAGDDVFADKVIIGRRGGETVMVSSDAVDYMDVSPKQIISVAASCVPFIEHDDATRALMGSNMQRQAVPIINPESPIVGTGMEYRAAKDSGSALIARNDGEVVYVDAKIIKIKEDTGELVNYELYQFLRSNSATAIMQRPIVKVGERVERGDIIADGQSMRNGELALGRNVRVAFMTWDGYNYEDAVIMSERMVYDDYYTSLHIDEYQVEARNTKIGREEILRDIPQMRANANKYLDKNGIVIPGTEVKEGDYLVGKITPKGTSEKLSPEKQLMYAIFGDKSKDVKDTSLKVPHGGGGVVQSVKHYSKKNGDELPPQVEELVKVYVVQKRKIKVGDKMAGRHGNKGVISNILPVEDMPFTADGEPIDIMLNPQGVPSRMNIGQVLELHLGIAAKKLGIKVATPVFDGATIEDIQDIMHEAGINNGGKEILFDGRTGEPFENRINVGIMYFVKLSHMVDDKLHARATGHYTLVTQQPMGGKAQNGGQRFGEMEVWALEAYGAAHTLQEMLTLKSDDIEGRNNMYNAIVSGQPLPEPSIPDSFRVLTRELQALGLHVELIDQNGNNEVLRSSVNLNTYIEQYNKAENQE